MRRPLLIVSFVLMLSALAATATDADAARRASASEIRALSAATAAYSSRDSLTLDRRGLLVERDQGSTRRFVLQGHFVSTYNRTWARVVVASSRGERYSTVLRLVNRQWRALASDRLNSSTGANRDGRTCVISRIPHLAAIDLALGRNGAFDPRRRCEGAFALRTRAISPPGIATEPDWSEREDFGGCSLTYPGDASYPVRAYASRARPAWSLVHVWCTSGTVDGVPALGEFGAILRSGAPVERISLSELRPTERCTNRALLSTMPLIVRLQLGVCTVPDARLLNLSR